MLGNSIQDNITSTGFTQRAANQLLQRLCAHPPEGEGAKREVEEEADVGEETKRGSELSHSQMIPQASHCRQLPSGSKAGASC